MSDYRIVTGRRKQLEERIAELEATIKRVKEVRHEMDYADPKSRNHWKSQLDKALGEAK